MTSLKCPSDKLLTMLSSMVARLSSHLWRDFCRTSSFGSRLGIIIFQNFTDIIPRSLRPFGHSRWTSFDPLIKQAFMIVLASFWTIAGGLRRKHASLTHFTATSRFNGEPWLACKSVNLPFSLEYASLPDSIILWWSSSCCIRLSRCCVRLLCCCVRLVRSRLPSLILTFARPINILFSCTSSSRWW